MRGGLAIRARTGHPLKLDHLPFYFLLAALCLAPLPYGAVQIWAWSLLVAATGAALSGWALVAMFGGGPSPRFRRAAVPLAALALVLVWIAVQLSPWTPAAWHHPVWAMAQEGLAAPVDGRIAIDPQAGWFGLIRLASYGAIFWLACQYGADSRLARQALRIFVIAGAAAAGLGVVIWSAGLSNFLWFDESFLLAQLRYGARLALPFVNPNHLAGFAAMGLICALGLIAGEVRGLWRPETARREKLRRFVDAVLSRQWPLVVSVVIFATAVVLSQSRGGAAALLVGLLVLWAALMRRGKAPVGRIALIAAGAVIAAGLLFAPAFDRFAGRVDTLGTEAQQRMDIYRDTLGAIEASPVLGYGLGSFPALYRMYDDRDLFYVVEFAHSTVLETVVELGIPAALLLFAAALWPVAGVWRGAGARRRDQHVPALAAGVAAWAITHSLVDFPLQIPAIAAGVCLVIGLGFAQAISSKSGS